MPVTTSVLVNLSQFNINILKQAIHLIDLLENENNPSFDYGKFVGPHIRHVIDHYTALFLALEKSSSVLYDVRERDELLQTCPNLARTTIENLINIINELLILHPEVFTIEKPVKTVFMIGEQELEEVELNSTLGRELIFVTHHAIHHFAIISKYCMEEGIKLDSNFGKAPSTIAFEKYR